jgi:endonuclease YncB( thermonuclease family)
MHPLVCLLLIASASAVETKPVPVLRVIDGNTIEVGSDLGGMQVPLRVRLLYVDTRPSAGVTAEEEVPDMAAIALGLMLGDSDSVVLWAPGTDLRSDAAGSVIACVVPTPWIDGDKPAAMSGVSAALIAHGLSAYWRKPGEAPEPLHMALLQIQEKAIAEKSGLWSTAPQWMQAKADERPAAAEEP